MPCNPLKCQCGRPFLPQRYVTVLLISFATIILFVQRESFGLIVAHYGIDLMYKANVSIPCGGMARNRYGNDIVEWEFQAQSFLFASFFIGFVLMLLPGGFIADKFGARMIILVSMFATSILTGIYPFIVNYTFFWLVCTGRAVTGGASACLLTSTSTLIQRWIPKPQYATVCGLVFSCHCLGMVFVHVNYLSAKDSLKWDVIFYIWGGIGLGWCAIASLWLFSSPETHPSMTTREKVYLEEEKKTRSELPLDWVAVFTDSGVGALVAAQIGHAYLLYTIMMNITFYYEYALNLDLQQLLPYIIGPYIGVWALAIASGLLADFLIYRFGIKLKPVYFRKIYYGVGTLIPAILIVVIAHLECRKEPIFIIIPFAKVLTGFFYSSIRPNVLEMTYNYPGFVTGAICLCGAFVYGITPFLMPALMIKNNFTYWKIVSFVIFGNCLLNTIIYSVFGSSKRRAWDMSQEEKDYYRDLKAKEDEEKKKADAAPPPPKA